ncbi:hypothetical protein os1_35260 [Comamonadaceae bacterium OS-1]|nr:hypothetical protein os1_35260 [Comamonadaceae bacterium OS-1]
MRAAMGADDGAVDTSLWQLKGNAALGARLYSSPHEPTKESHRLAVRLAPEWRWADGGKTIVISPALYLEGDHNGRTRVDLNELYFSTCLGETIVKAGLSRLFWGVTESRHLVDVVNPPDLAHHYAAEQRLSTAMLYVAHPTPVGQLEVLLLPWERDPVYPNTAGRPRTDLPIHNAVEHPNGTPPAFAARLAISQGDYDSHVYFFRGLDRESALTARTLPYAAPTELTATRRLVRQWGADLQVPVGNFLVKSELAHRSGYSRDFLSGVLGGEYALNGINGSVVDVNLLGEYQFDLRPADAPLTTLSHGIYAGVRVALNDPASTEFKFGVVAEPSTGARLWRGDASRRIAKNWTVEGTMSVFDNVRKSPSLMDYRKESYVEVLAKYHFQ